MFTGIIEEKGIVSHLESEDTNLLVYINSPLASTLHIDQSVAHNGVCLTVDQLHPEWHRCTLIKETLSKTNFRSIQVGDVLNLERCVPANGRMDGHFVQGHVDTTVKCNSVTDENGSWVYNFLLPNEYKNLVVSKGSICINGVSLTISKLLADAFEVSIIPYTYNQTNFSALQANMFVNIEFDILGKYIQRILSNR